MYIHVYCVCESTSYYILACDSFLSKTLLLSSLIFLIYTTVVNATVILKLGHLTIGNFNIYCSTSMTPSTSCRKCSNFSLLNVDILFTIYPNMYNSLTCIHPTLEVLVVMEALYICDESKKHKYVCI